MKLWCLQELPLIIDATGVKIQEYEGKSEW